MKKFFLFGYFIFIAVYSLYAQEPLPEFKVQNLGKGKVQVGWKNEYGSNLVQLNVQRSYDSSRFFRTIFSPLSPELPENGFVDNKGNSALSYYRIFYVLENGLYFFTPAKRAATGFDATEDLSDQELENLIITVQMQDSIIATLHFSQFKLFRDSIINRTRDSLFVMGQNTVLLKKFDSSNIWIPSLYIFSSEEGYVSINLPEAYQKKYSLKIFDNHGKPLFNIKRITEPFLKLDKTNFMRAGWFTFELFEDDKLKEKNKFYLQKDF